MIHVPAGVINDLGWTLIHFLWQGLLLAAVLQVILPMCRDAGARHNWALAILAMMVLAPVLTFLFIHGHESAGTSLIIVSGTGFSGVHTGGAIVSRVPMQFDWTGLLVALWLSGIVVLSLRALGGWYLVEMLWRRDTFALPDDLLQRCRTLQKRLALSRPIIFLQSALVNAPVVIGWFRPIILVPISAVSGLTPQQLDALILHELAHIRRFDTFTNILLVMAETLLFYHPAVWWVSRRVRIEREHCCDDFAVAMCGDAAIYVEALTSLKISKAMPVLVLAASGGKLKDRVARLLDVPSKSRKISPSAVIGLLFLGAVAATAATAQNNKEDVAATAPRAHVAARIAPQKAAAHETPGHATVAPVPVDVEYPRPAARKPHARIVSPPVSVPTDEVVPAPATVTMPAQDVGDQVQAAVQPVQVAALQVSQTPAAPAAAPAPTFIDSSVERIVVTARKWLGDSPLTMIHNFVNSYTSAATPTIGAIARWNFVVCARTYGLTKPEYEDFVTKRVEDIAVVAGMTVKSGPCHYSVEIVFTPRPQEFLDKVHQTGALLLGPKPSQAEANATMRYPVQAWYATATRDRTGQLLLDDEDDARFVGSSSELPVYNLPWVAVDGFRWRTGLSSELAHIYVVVDTSKTEGYTLGSLADYVAVVALSQTQNFDVCKPMPSITNLISPACDADLKPAAITDSDLAYLEAVYTMTPGANLKQEQNFIADRMALALGVK